MKDFREFLLRGNLVDVCLSEVPVLARRCAFCTAEIGAAAA